MSKVTRRNVLAGVGAATALAAMPGTVSASPTDPVVGLYADWCKAMERMKAATADYCRRADSLPRWVDGAQDWHNKFSAMPEIDMAAHPAFGAGMRLANLSNRPRREDVEKFNASVMSWSNGTPADVARRERECAERLAIFDARQAEAHAERVKAGLPEASDASERATAAALDLEQQLLATPATSVAGIRAKLCVLGADEFQWPPAGPDLTADPEEMCLDEQIIRGVLRDLDAMLEGGAA